MNAHVENFYKKYKGYHFYKEEVEEVHNPEAARQRAELRVSLIASVVSAVAIHSEMIWSPDALVVKKKNNFPTALRKAEKKIGIQPTKVNSDLIDNRIQSVWNSLGSLERAKSIDSGRLLFSLLNFRGSLAAAHDHAALSMTWTCIESLLPEGHDGTLDRCERSFLHTVTFRYPQSRMESLCRYLIWHHHRGELIGKNRGEKEAAIRRDLARKIILTAEDDIGMVLDEYKENPLTCSKIVEFRKRFRKRTDYLSSRRNHEKRVKWQIARIYRGRNFILHNGFYPGEIESLIFHGRNYFVKMLDTFTFLHKNHGVLYSLEDYFYSSQQSNFDLSRQIERMETEFSEEHIENAFF